MSPVEISALINGGVAAVFAVFAIIVIRVFMKFIEQNNRIFMNFLRENRQQREVIMKEAVRSLKELTDKINERKD